MAAALAVAVVLILLDMAPGLIPETGMKSEVVFRPAAQYKGIGWGLGVLLGHFVWPMPHGWRQRSQPVYWTLLASLLALLVFFLLLPNVADVLFRYTIVAFAVGIPMGHFMWPVATEK